MPRLPLTLRALVLVPLLAVGVDLARATLAAGRGRESCLEAAGQGWLGVAGVVLLVLYALGSRRRRRPAAAARAPGFLRLWLVGSAGVAAVCGGQALLAGALGAAARSAAAGPSWSRFCLVAGALLALALRRRARRGRARARAGAGRAARRCSSRSWRRQPPPRRRPRAGSSSRSPPPAALHRSASADPRAAAAARPARASAAAAPQGDRPCPARIARFTKRGLREPRRADRLAAERAEAAAPARRRAARCGCSPPSAGSPPRPSSPPPSLVLRRLVTAPPPGARGAARAPALFAGIPERDGVLGDPGAPVTVTEYVDLQCPVCAEASRDDAARARARLRAHRQGEARGPDAAVHRPGLRARRARRRGRRAPGPAVAVPAAFYAAQGQENSGYVTDAFLRSVARAAGVDADGARARRGPARPRGAAQPGQRRRAALGVDSTPTFAVAGAATAPRAARRRAQDSPHARPRDRRGAAR